MATSVYQDQDQDHGGCDVEGTTGMGHWTPTSMIATSARLINGTMM
jgi:hypothetical protein